MVDKKTMEKLRTDAPLEETTHHQPVVLFVGLSKDSKALTAVAAKVPSDIIPFPSRDLKAMYARGRPTVAISGIVLCVPREQLDEDDVTVLRELEQVLPVFSLLGQNPIGGREFFERCREAHSRIPRDPNRRVYRVPAVVHAAAQPADQHLLRIENVSSGGLFIQDPELTYGVEDLVRLRLPGRGDILVDAEVRWRRERKRPGEPLGYGCSFQGVPERAIRKLLELAESAPAPKSANTAPRK